MLSPNRIKPSAWLIYTNRCNAPTRQRVIFDRTSLRFDSNRSSPYHKANVVNNESPFLLSILLSYIFFLNVRRITASASLHAPAGGSSCLTRQFRVNTYIFFILRPFSFSSVSSFSFFRVHHAFHLPAEKLWYIFLSFRTSFRCHRGSFTAYIPVTEVDRMSQKGNVIKRTDLDDDDDDNDKKATTSSSIFLFPFFFLSSLLAFVFIPQKENPSTIS